MRFILEWLLVGLLVYMFVIRRILSNNQNWAIRQVPSSCESQRVTHAFYIEVFDRIQIPASSSLDDLGIIDYAWVPSLIMQTPRNSIGIVLWAPGASSAAVTYKVQYGIPVSHWIRSRSTYHGDTTVWLSLNEDGPRAISERASWSNPK